MARTAAVRGLPEPAADPGGQVAPRGAGPRRPQPGGDTVHGQAHPGRPSAAAWAARTTIHAAGAGATSGGGAGLAGAVLDLYAGARSEPAGTCGGHQGHDALLVGRLQRVPVCSGATDGWREPPCKAPRRSLAPCAAARGAASARSAAGRRLMRATPADEGLSRRCSAAAQAALGAPSSMTTACASS